MRSGRKNKLLSRTQYFAAKALAMALLTGSLLCVGIGWLCWPTLSWGWRTVVVVVPILGSTSITELKHIFRSYDAYLKGYKRGNTPYESDERSPGR
jgi:hypothetical protein